ncbi:MAG: AI-2E family transporter [Mariprofundales bacterium]
MANNPASVRILYACAALVIVIAGIKAAAVVIIPLLLSIFLAIISLPILASLQKHGISTAIAVLSIVSLLFFVGLLLTLLITSSIDAFMQALPEYQQRLRLLAASILAWIEGFGFLNLNLPREQLLGLIDPGKVMQLAGGILSGVGNVLTNTFMIGLTVIFILFEAAGFSDKLRIALGGDVEKLQPFNRFATSLQHYMLIKTGVSLLTGIAVATALFALDIDFALLWGVLAFLLNYIPNIGSIMAALPAVLLALVQIGIMSALLTAGVFILVNVIIGNIIEPRLMGKGLGLSVMVVFISLLFWGWMLGPVGMLLSVPLTMTVKIALETDPHTNWLAILLGPEKEALP